MWEILGTGGSGFLLQVIILRIDLLDADTKEGTKLFVECTDCLASGEAAGRKRRWVPAVDGKAAL
jgi:hypothetical protein